MYKGVAWQSLSPTQSEYSLNPQTLWGTMGRSCSRTLQEFKCDLHSSPGGAPRVQQWYRLLMRVYHPHHPASHRQTSERGKKKLKKKKIACLQALRGLLLFNDWNCLWIAYLQEGSSMLLDILDRNWKKSLLAHFLNIAKVSCWDSLRAMQHRQAA